MPDYLVVQHCAPTLAGLKTGNMFTASFESEQHLEAEVDRLNEVLTDKGLRVSVLRIRRGEAGCAVRALLYVYRPGQLQNDLDREEAREILAKYGYEGTDCERCIRKLTGRLHGCSDFPHEIGLFLGYPPEDVKGFIELGSRKCKACGYWKVYGDVDQAQRQFDRFTKCTGVYLKCLERGMPFARLAVKKKVTA